MISLKTQIAIAVLSDIYVGSGSNQTLAFTPSALLLDELLHRFSKKGLIHLTDPDHPSILGSYEPIKPSHNISLLDILEAIDEHLDCNHPTTELFYSQYARAAPRLGIINQITRLYLQKIKLIDL